MRGTNVLPCYDFRNLTPFYATILAVSSRVRIFFITAFVLVAVTVVVTLWAKGYTLERESRTLEKTGMIAAKSTPDGAKVVLDGKLATATNATIPNLKPGLHHLKIEKEGYLTWEKEVPVEAELVTPVEALLVPLAPELKPLTSQGISLTMQRFWHLKRFLSRVSVYHLRIIPFLKGQKES